MPIRADNRHRYPADWKAIHAAILARTGDPRRLVRDGPTMTVTSAPGASKTPEPNAVNC